MPDVDIDAVRELLDLRAEILGERRAGTSKRAENRQRSLLSLILMAEILMAEFPPSMISVEFFRDRPLHELIRFKSGSTQPRWRAAHEGARVALLVLKTSPAATLPASTYAWRRGSAKR